MQGSPAKQKGIDVFGIKRISSPELTTTMKLLDRVLKKDQTNPGIGVTVTSPRIEHPRPTQSRQVGNFIHPSHSNNTDEYLKHQNNVPIKSSTVGVLENLQNVARKTSHQLANQTQMMARPKQSASHSGASIEVYSVGHPAGHRRGYTANNLAGYLSQETLNPLTVDWKVPGMGNKLQESLILDNDGPFSRKQSSGGANKMFESKPKVKYEAIRDFLVCKEVKLG